MHRGGIDSVRALPQDAHGQAVVPPRPDPDAYLHAVLAVVELIPAGRVLTYGDVAELLESGGPRQVGRALSRSTRDVPWWRVLRAGGLPPRGLAARARAHYEDEGTALSVPSGSTDPERYRVDLPRSRWWPSAAEQELVAALSASLRSTVPRVGTPVAVPLIVRGM